jgi:hypothetical protein
VFVDIVRQGQDAVITVELDPNRLGKGSGEKPELVVVPPGTERTEPIKPDFTWVGPDTLEGRFRMDRTGSWRTLVKTRGQEIKRGPAVTLPYSPEFDPRDGLPLGKEILADVADLSGGTERTDVLSVLRNPPRSSRTSSLLPWLFIVGLTLLVLEIAGRRLSLWDRLTDAATAAVPESASPRRWLPKWGLPTVKSRKAPVAEESPAPAAATARAAGKDALRAASPAEKSPPPAEPSRPAADVFAAAKQKAKRRLK